MISANELRTEELRLKYLELIQRPDVFPTRANWQFITSNAMRGLGFALYHKYLTALTIDDNDRQQLHDIAVEEFPAYLAAIDRDEALEVIYSDVTTAPAHTAELIRNTALFSAEHIIDLLNRGCIKFAIDILDVYQPSYGIDDVEPIERLIELIDRLPSSGKIERKTGIFGSTEKYVCPRGHVNPPDTEYCHHAGCGMNARGLTESQEKNIAVLGNRLNALKSILSQLGYNF